MYKRQFIHTHREVFRPDDRLTGPYEHPLEQPITADDIKYKLPQCRNSVQGPDGIPNKVLKALPDIALDALSQLYTTSLQLGYTLMS